MRFPTVIDSTALTKFRACPRSFRNRFCLGLTPDGKSIHLAAGGAFAAACDAYRRAFFGGSSPVRGNHDAALAEAFRVLAIAYGDLDPGTTPKSFDRLAVALVAYFDKYSDTPHYLNDEPCSEFTFAVPLPIAHPDTGEPLLFGGRFDLLAETRWGLTIIDEKTTTGIGPKWSQQWTLRGQFIGYCWATQQRGFSTSSVLVRGIALLKTDIKFAEAILLIPEHLIQRWEAELYRTIEAMVACYETDTWAYDFGDACDSYGGCPYKVLCQAKTEEPWLDTFQVSFWNPLAETNEDPDAPLFTPDGFLTQAIER